MPLRVAVQMDPLEGIGIAGDSTFALMLKAQELGHKLYHYLAEDLTYEEGRLYAGVREVTVLGYPDGGLELVNRAEVVQAVAGHIRENRVLAHPGPCFS